jgi:Gpi18-like mannosyltransferase
MFGVAFLIRVLLFSTQGYQNDMITFTSWFNTAADFGPRLFYDTVSWCDYPPFNVYLFWGFGSLTQALGLFGTSSAAYIVKLVPNIFDMLIGGLIYLFVRKQFSFKLAILASAFYIFNPAIIFNAAVWGQFDAVYTFFMLLSLILALKRQPELSAASFAISILTKPQSIALLPIVAFVIFKKSNIKRFLFSVAAFAATIFAVILPMQWSNPVNFLYNIYFGAYSGYAYTSINAFNLWGLFGLWRPDGNLFILGWISFAAFSVFTVYVLNKRWNKLSSDHWLIFFAAFMMLFAFFMLPTRIHERYLFPAISMLALITPFIKKARVFYVVITATFLSNIAYILYWLNLYAKDNNPYSPNLSYDPVVIVVCVINIIMFIYGSLLMWRELENKKIIKNELPEDSEPKTGLIPNEELGDSNLKVESPPEKRSFNFSFNINKVFSFNINKKDIITMILLSTIFFSIAITSLGATQVPSNGLKIADNEQPQIAILDLGGMTSVSTISFYIKDSQDTKIKIYTGQPGEWFESGTITVTYPFAYMNWHSLNIRDTRYIRLEFEALTDIEINELIVLDSDNHLVPISSITCENDDNTLNFNLLIDEQDIVVLPRTYFTETMFDEVYFTRTAEQYLNQQWPYEWTHPPLGKLIIASGITVFGLNPFGWRIMGVIFGTLMIPIIFLLGKKMFGSYIGGFTAAFLLTFDFMHFTEARLGITDTYLAFFSILSQLFFFIYLSNVIRKGWKNASVIPLFFSFMFFALGFSTKWLVLFGFLGAMAILIIMRFSDLIKTKSKTISDKFYAFFEYPYAYIMLFIIIAIGIYFATYIPDMLAGRSLMNVAQLQDAMYTYHAAPIGLDHPYSSPGWSWPLIEKPLWLYINYLPADMRSTISLFGNPAVWWIGFAAIITLTGATILKAVAELKKRRIIQLEISAIFLSVVFFAQWLPYALISRGLFIYHYYVSVPIICLASAYFISKYWKYTWMKIAALAYFATVIALFVLFYPVISGTPVSTITSESLRWFNQWVF